MVVSDFVILVFPHPCPRKTFSSNVSKVHCVLPGRIFVGSCCHDMSIISQLKTIFACIQTVTGRIRPKQKCNYMYLSNVPSGKLFLSILFCVVAVFQKNVKGGYQNGPISAYNQVPIFLV